MMETKEFNIAPLITNKTFERQGWEMQVDTDGEDDEGKPIEYYYWTLPLPKDNPDIKAICLSTILLNIKKALNKRAFFAYYVIV